VNSQNYDHFFRCTKCQKRGAIFLLKVNNNQIIIKQRCPQHGAKSFKVPLTKLADYIEFIKDSMFRCYKCGEKTTLQNIKFSGPWALLKGYCPTHKDGLPVQKIWSAIYITATEIDIGNIKNIIISENQEEYQHKENNINNYHSKSLGNTKNVSNPESSIPEIKFCVNCGTKIRGEERYCSVCGSKIR